MECYRLAELAQITAVTPRTIRFYIAEGLLPPPEGSGPAAVYTAEHRDRLRLIGILKDRYLPLKEIRRQLATLSQAEVRDRIRQEEGSAVTAPESTPASAVAYLDDVLDRRGATHMVREPSPSRAVPPARMAAALPLPGSGYSAAPANAPAAAPPREQWERIVLSEGVELHIREDQRRATGPLEALIRQARKLLGEA